MEARPVEAVVIKDSPPTYAASVNQKDSPPTYAASVNHDHEQAPACTTGYIITSVVEIGIKLVIMVSKYFDIAS